MKKILTNTFTSTYSAYIDGMVNSWITEMYCKYGNDAEEIFAVENIGVYGANGEHVRCVVYSMTTNMKVVLFNSIELIRKIWSRAMTIITECRRLDIQNLDNDPEYSMLSNELIDIAGEYNQIACIVEEIEETFIEKLECRGILSDNNHEWEYVEYVLSTLNNTIENIIKEAIKKYR